MAEYDSNIPIGLLVGLNCPRAQEPYESIHGKDNTPYAVRYALGWCVMGPVRNLGDTKIKCNRIKLQYPSSDVNNEAISKHHFAITEAVKDNYVTDKLKEMWSTDFIETNGDEKALSFEDKQFLKIMSDNIRQVNGKYELPLPFKNDSNPKMPESR